MTRWPWITMLLAVLIAISPPGRDIVYDAVCAREGLSRNIAQFLVCIGLGVAVLIAALEWLVRLILSRRRARGATSS